MKRYLCRMLAAAILILNGSMAGWAQFNPPNPQEPSLTYRVNVGMTPDNIGYYNGGGTYQDGEDVWIHAYSWNSNYVFDYWEMNGQEYSREQSFWYRTTTQDVSFVAHFRFDPQDPNDPEAVFRRRVYVKTDPERAGWININSGQSYVVGEEVWLASYNSLSSYRFVGWYNGDEMVSDQNTFSFTIGDKDVNLTARYAFDPTLPDDPTSDFVMKCYVDVQSNDDAYGAVSADGLEDGAVIAGEYITLHAVPAEGCMFEGWSDGKSIVSSNTDWRVLVTGNRHFTAFFHRDQAQESGNVVEMSSADGTPGSVVDVDLSLFNEGDIAAAEFIIPLGDNLSYVKDSFVPYKANLGKHSATASVVDGKLRVYVFSTDLSPLRKPADKIGTFKVKLRKKPSVTSIAPEVKLVDTNGNELAKTVKDATITVLAAQIEVDNNAIDFGHEPIRGTYSRTVTVSNTGTSALSVSGVECSSAQLEVLPAAFVLATGESKQLTITYKPAVAGSISETITIKSDAVNGDMNIGVAADPYSVNILSIGNSTIDAGSDANITVGIDNMEPLAAVQFSVSLPEGVSLIDGSFIPTDRSLSMQYSISQDGSVMKLCLYSLSGAVIEEGNGGIGTFKLRTNGVWGTVDLIPEGVVLGSTSMANVASSTVPGAVVVRTAKIGCESVADLGRVSVTDQPSYSFPVRNDGQLPLVIREVTFSGGDFVLGTALPFTIQPGEQSSITVGCSVAKGGEYAGVMSISTNDAITPTTEVAVKASAYEPNELSATAYFATGSSRLTMNISLDHFSEVHGLQFNITGMCSLVTTADLLELNTELSDFTSALISEGNGVYKVLVYSQSNAPIPATCKDICTITFTDVQDIQLPLSLSITDVIISNELNENVASSTSSDVFVKTYGSLSLVEGWNWVSHSLATAMPQESFQQNGIMRVQTQTAEMVYDTNWNTFVGDIGDVLATQAIKVQTNTSVSIPLIGDMYNPVDNAVTLVKGWNWIGYPFEKAQTLDAAFSMLEAETDDYIVGKSGGFATYDGSQWVGSLEILEPGQGYLYKSAGNKQFHYDGSAAYVSDEQHPLLQAATAPWTADAHKYPNVMCITAELRDFNGSPLRAEDYHIAAFADNECRGIAKPVNGIYFISVFGDKSVPLTFRAQNVVTNEEFDLPEGIDFKADVLGTVSAPFAFSIDDVSAITSVNEDQNATECIYNLAGKRLNNVGGRGFYILKSSESGKARKIYVK